jgi:hypothetical protein
MMQAVQTLDQGTQLPILQPIDWIIFFSIGRALARPFCFLRGVDSIFLPY